MMGGNGLPMAFKGPGIQISPSQTTSFCNVTKPLPVLPTEGIPYLENKMCGQIVGLELHNISNFLPIPIETVYHTFAMYCWLRKVTTQIKQPAIDPKGTTLAETQPINYPMPAPYHGQSNKSGDQEQSSTKFKNSQKN
ncbi:hypothetical protein O181_077080 [Austropuccinia psidii MF-1]|uniref:Uncharacterized protein n=1 Tax=Austropuccinia psidii MF-1 TaxID=1389203 RepID=A0A9Q3FHD4_9BASI|nr:hypothetical protein [Austropuccinia psidii MF-1]